MVGGGPAAHVPGLDWDRIASPHTFPPGTKLPPDFQQNNSGKSKPFAKREKELLRTTFADLASRSASGKSIDRETFLKFFAHVPGLLGERLFAVFNRSGSGSLDWDEFRAGLACFSRGSPEQRVQFVFQMVNLSGSGLITRGELETMCNSFVFAAESIQRAATARDAAAVAARAGQLGPAGMILSPEPPNHHASNAAASGGEAQAAPSEQRGSVMLRNHLQQMANRAHSPSFQYSPQDDHAAPLADALKGAEETDFNPLNTSDGTSAGAAASAATLGATLQPLNVASASPSPQPFAGGAALGRQPSISESLESSPDLDPANAFSPSGRAAEPDWVHASRVKHMVDDAFTFAAPRSIAGTAPAGAGDAAPGAGGAAVPVDPAAGLTVYQFGRWLQAHPEILEVLDAAFAGGEGGTTPATQGFFYAAPSASAGGAAAGDAGGW